MSINITDIRIANDHKELSKLINPLSLSAKKINSMMDDADRLLVVKIEQSNGYSSMVYNPTDNSFFTGFQTKFGADDYSPIESLTSDNILLNIKRDLDKLEPRDFKDKSLMEVGRTIKNNEKVLLNNVSITDEIVSFNFYAEDYKVDFSPQMIEIGSLLNENMIHDTIKEPTIDDLKEFILNANKEVVARATEIEKTVEKFDLRTKEEPIENEELGNWNEIPSGVFR